MYLARTALIGDTFQIELEFRNVGFFLVVSMGNLNLQIQIQILARLVTPLGAFQD